MWSTVVQSVVDYVVVVFGVRLPAVGSFTGGERRFTVGECLHSSSVFSLSWLSRFCVGSVGLGVCFTRKCQTPKKDKKKI